MAGKSLGDVPVGLAWVAQQAALMRLQLFLIGETHRMLGEFADEARAVVMKVAGEDGKLDGMGLHLGLQGLGEGWKGWMGRWVELVGGLKREAAKIPFGTLAVLHRKWMGRGLQDRNESEGRGRRWEEQEGEEDFSGVFEPQLQAVLDGAQVRLWGDGLQWSQRIWNLEQRSMEGMKRVVFQGVAEGESAWNLAKALEEFLGPGRECPRWTSTRLYKLTKADIAAGDPRGLYSKELCAGQGVAYNALRLARTEIQYAHGLATDTLMARMPWIEKEQVHLNPAHPDIGCECEEVAGGGERGEGIYEKGTITLPLHPNCMCYKSGVLMDADEFTRHLRGWMEGTEGWGAMDGYANWLGLGRAEVGGVSLAVGMATALTVWLWGEKGALEGAVGAG